MKKRLDHIWQSFLKENKCPYGCTLHSVPCEHLEDYIRECDEGAQTSVKLLLVPRIEDIHNRFIAPADAEGAFMPESSEQSIRNIVRKLEEFGLENNEVDIIVDRCLENLTFSEIAEKHGYTSGGMAYRHYKIVIEKLKRGKFGNSDE